MPEMQFRIRWPSGAEEACYSPSLVIKDYFEPGRRYPLPAFLARSREALTSACERVRARYGRPWSRARGQLRHLEATGRSFADLPEATVDVIAFEE